MNNAKRLKKIVKANQNTFRSKRSEHNLDKYLKSIQEYKYLCRDKNELITKTSQIKLKVQLITVKTSGLS